MKAFTAQQVADIFQVPVRTVRYHVAELLLPNPIPDEVVCDIIRRGDYYAYIRTCRPQAESGYPIGGSVEPYDIARDNELTG